MPGLVFLLFTTHIYMYNNSVFFFSHITTYIYIYIYMYVCIDNYRLLKKEGLTGEFTEHFLYLLAAAMALKVDLDPHKCCFL